MMSYKHYNAYKESDIHWAMEIPQKWNISKLKRIFQFEKGKNSNLLTEEYVKSNEGPYPVYSGQTKNNGVLGSIDSYEYDFKNNVILVTTVGAKAMTTFLINGKLSLSQNCALIKLKSSDDFSNYYYYLCKILFNYERGLIPDIMQPSLRIGDLNTYNIIKPPLEEQQQIANYLDKQTAKIDATIAKNEELIQLLEEKRVALINQVVTKGLNPDVPMKDSGVEWIGEIPEHWDVEKIKKYFTVHNGSTPKDTEDNWGGDICWITPADYKTTDIYINNSSRQITKTGVNSCGTTLVPKGSIIVSNRAPIGTVAIANVDLCTNQGCKSLAIKKDINTKFVYYLLSINEKELNKLGRGTTFMELSAYDLGAFLIPIAPLTEQKDIVTYLDKETSKINQTVSKIKENIILLEEYKTSLIHHVVTGKIDVRGEEI